MSDQERKLTSRGVEGTGNGGRHRRGSSDASDTDTHSDWALFQRIAREAHGFRRRIALILLLSLVATPLALLGPVPLKVVVDSVLGTDPIPGFLAPLVPDWFEDGGTRLLIMAALMQVLIVLLLQLQGLVSYLLQTSTGERLTLRFRARLLEHVQQLSFSFHDSRGTADSIYRIQYDAPSVQNMVVFSLVPFIASAVTLVSMIYVVFALNWQLAIVALAVSPFLYLYARAYRLRMRPRYKEAKHLESSALGVVQEILTSFRVVKAFGRENDEKERFVDRSGQSVVARIELALRESAFGLLVGLTTAVGTASVLVIGVRNIQAGALTLGELLMVLAYIGQLYGPLESIAKRVASLQNHLASAQRAYELLDTVPQVRERPNAKPLRRAQGRIELRSVSFSYDGTGEVLRDISLSIPAGTRLGIVGRTGVGKTTLVSLLNRFYDVTEGEILLDGVDIRDYRLADLRAQFTLMLQEPVLFSTTIAENIAYAKPSATKEEVIAAARAAGAHEFISGMPDGYDTIVGERGMRLSGGERQRVSLARAFLKDAPILLLDEPTSSVDVKTEEAIMDRMYRLMEGRTVFMIAHRPSTLQGCDALLELDDAKSTLVLNERARAPKDVTLPNR